MTQKIQPFGSQMSELTIFQKPLKWTYIGSEVTAVSESTPLTLRQLEVSMSDNKLCGPNSVPLDLIGRLTVTLSQK